MSTLTIFKNTGLEQPTPMQLSYWENDSPYSILLANTGSGKTLAFCVQLEVQLQKDVFNGQVLILCPTRELAGQVAKNYASLKTGRNTVLCYGGHSVKNESLQLQEFPQVIIATPGRILDHLKRGTVGLAGFSHLVIDEYDKTLEMGFMNEISQIYEYTNKLKSIQLVSATEIESLPDFLNEFSFITHNHIEEARPNLSYYCVESIGHDKLFALVSFLASKNFGPVLIFCSFREAAERISQHLNEYGKSNVLFHGGMEQIDRERSLVKFRNGSANCLVCTDLAARGIDIPEIEAVFHYQFPHTIQDFTHRNGRTARMKKDGSVYLIQSAEEPLPPYVNTFSIELIKAPEVIGEFNDAQFITYYLSAGRKHKIRKMDVVGFFLQETEIQKDELGMIDIYDTYSYVSIAKSRKKYVESLFPRVRIKKQPVLISKCR
jgi:superfamily II DNA/RNA helicase